MPWFKVDDKLHDHPKTRKAGVGRRIEGVAAMGLWVLAGSYAADNLTDGFVPEHTLTRWVPTTAIGRRLASYLVAANLWHVDEQDDEPGWRFHEWAERQPTRAAKLAERAARAEAGRLGGLNSGRSRRAASTKQPASPLLEPPSRPVPTRTVVTKSSQSQTDQHEVSTDGLDRIKKLTRGTDGHARKCAEFVLAKAPTDVRNPDAYVIAAITDAPDEFRFKRGNPKKHEECPTHAGQWADACAGCAADRKAAS